MDTTLLLCILYMVLESLQHLLAIYEVGNHWCWEQED